MRLHIPVHFPLLAALVLLALVTAPAIASTDVVGQWRTIDDETGQPKSIVEIYEKNGLVYGKVVRLLQKPQDTVCEKCPGDLKGKKLVGMDVVTRMRKVDGRYEEGQIMDPISGKVYGCKMWREGNMLKVRGYIGPFYRTQVWQKVQ
ncbi:DUF2147 domain-containing protein [Biformimicrobium ophioploci]|uniref:DUF2147 domain-containing protein n=1 Tax=Biformimicrobium ophioploci TaxID=3036711 RepID=A0ABQ6M0X7_9GAMM|nr:DUF2147 domain-containing protein [Microbulbifer sp. NKW57]GMG88000.1 DUF2147 domain-containing protein [Microbulbifer sp. NKW57]